MGATRTTRAAAATDPLPVDPSAVAPQADPSALPFSVVVPLYNKAPFVRSSLGSVLAQTFGRFELLVLDDGSTDGGAERAETLGDPRVRVVRQRNAGVSAARNAAIAMARGEWVLFLDADDWQHPQLLAVLRATQRACPQADCVATRFVEFTDPTGSPPPRWPVPPGPPRVELIDDLAAHWMRGPTLFTGSIAVRRRLLEQLQPCFQPGESFGEDLELWFRISERTPIALVHAPLAAYRACVRGSLSDAPRPWRLPPWVGRMRRRVQSAGFDPRRRRSALVLADQLSLNMAREAIAAGHRGAALTLLAEAFRAIAGRRWWVTAAMALCCPRGLALKVLQRGARGAAPEGAGEQAAWPPPSPLIPPATRRI
ncbi:glycosyltransferase family 2 protein [Ramlibacter sp.]|uniref:glycosyltransferase family 2 protein n=1 Tax=Ramlibacter sp. TaxID=1917967 RepID=UPI002FC97074